MATNNGQKAVNSQCPICGRTSENHQIMAGEDYVTYRCSYCSGDFSQTSARLDYRKDMYKKSGGVVRDSYKLETMQNPETHLEQPLRWYILSLAENYLGKLPVRGKFLDVGCGVGTFTKIVKDLGYDVYAFDPAEEAIKYAREKFGLVNTYAGTIKNIPPDWQQFDVIAALEVIEHVENPRELVGRIFDLLKPGGMFIISVPNRSRLGIKFWGIEEWDKPPNHLTRWSLQVLKFFLSDLGFKDLKIRMDDLNRRSLSIFLPPGWNQKITANLVSGKNQSVTDTEKTLSGNILWKGVQWVGDLVVSIFKAIAGGIINKYLANSLITVARKPL